MSEQNSLEELLETFMEEQGRLLATYDLNLSSTKTTLENELEKLMNLQLNLRIELDLLRNEMKSIKSIIDGISQGVEPGSNDNDRISIEDLTKEFKDFKRSFNTKLAVLEAFLNIDQNNQMSEEEDDL